MTDRESELFLLSALGARPDADDHLRHARLLADIIARHGGRPTDILRGAFFGLGRVLEDGGAAAVERFGDAVTAALKLPCPFRSPEADFMRGMAGYDDLSPSLKALCLANIVARAKQASLTEDEEQIRIAKAACAHAISMVDRSAHHHGIQPLIREARQAVLAAAAILEARLPSAPPQGRRRNDCGSAVTGEGC